VFLAWGHLSQYEGPGIMTMVGAAFILTGLFIKTWDAWKRRDLQPSAQVTG